MSTPLKRPLMTDEMSINASTVSDGWSRADSAMRRHEDQRRGPDASQDVKNRPDDGL